MVRWDSPLVLSIAGTFAIHVILLVAADVVAVTHPLQLDPPPPRIKLIDVQVQRRRSPPVHREEPKVAPVVKPTEPLRPRVPTHAASQVHTAPTPAQPVEPPPTATLSPTAGGDGPVVAIDDLGPAATGVAVGKHSGGGGRGAGPGSGTGIGSGSGSGSGSGAAPVSIATIKQLALPKRDYGYVLSKDYPPEAKRLAIEGTLKVRLVVDANGKVISATLLDHLGHGLDELALTQARTFEFTPARDADDRAVTSVVVWTFRMTPPK